MCESREGRQRTWWSSANGGRAQAPFVPDGTWDISGQRIPALKGWAIVKEDAAPTGLGSSPSGWERMPKAGEGFSFFDFGSTNMPRRRRWGRTPCQNHFALDVWGIWRLNFKSPNVNAILKRQLAGLGEYVDPKALLDEILPTIEQILKQTSQAKLLTDQQRNKYLEKFQAAFLAFMLKQASRNRAEITVCVKESVDFDCVLKAIELDGKIVFRPVQLKELPSHHQFTKIQEEIDKLEKYTPGLAVAFWINRDIKFDLSELRFYRLKIQQLWFFGDSPTGEVTLHGGNIHQLISGYCIVGIMKDGKLRIRPKKFKPCGQIEIN